MSFSKRPISFELPDGEFMEMDDAKIQAFLLGLGVLERLRMPNKKDVDSLFYGIQNHPTHWLLTVRFWNKPCADDNGFILFGWPKKIFNAHQANEKTDHVFNRYELFHVESQSVFRDASDLKSFS